MSQSKGSSSSSSRSTPSSFMALTSSIPHDSPNSLVHLISASDYHFFVRRNARCPSKATFPTRKNSRRYADVYVERRRELLERKLEQNRLATSSPDDRRNDYLTRRVMILEKIFCIPDRRNSFSTDSTNTYQVDLSASDVISTISSDADDFFVQTQAGDGMADSLSSAYAFVGMHHIFEHSSPVTSVRFANNRKDLIAFGYMDGQACIAVALPIPGIVRRLQGHSAGVSDLNWSLTNEYIVTTSFDHTVRVWDAQTGACVREFQTNGPSLCVRFHPNNSNMFVIGLAASMITSYNLSTGRPIQSHQADSSVHAVTFDTKGDILFIGTSKGFVHIFSCTAAGQLRHIRKDLISKTRKCVTSLQFSNWQSSQQPSPSLLINTADNLVQVYNILPNYTRIALRRQYQVAHTKHTIHSIFCPLISFRNGACIVTGSEDHNVYMFDVVNRMSRCINKLQGHSGEVLDVSWNYDESLLASCDNAGVVILWKRRKVTTEDLKTAEQ